MYNDDYKGPTLLKQLTEYAEELAGTPYVPPTPPADPATEELRQLLNDARITPDQQVQAPPVCLQINDNGEAASVCTLGNFSLAIGKAKSRKSFFTALTFSIVTGYENDKFTGMLPPERNEGIYFDTEQSKYHVQKVLERICRLTGKPNADNIQVYSLRKFPPRKRMEMIELALYSNDRIGFVVIDGIRDLVTSINDEEQATYIAAQLLRWTEERGIHIMAVLHQNKGDLNARGHLGSELTNKAETVLSVCKYDEDKNLSVVEAAFARNKDFNPFAFSIDATGLPEVVSDWEAIKPEGKEKLNIIQQLGDRNIYSLASECFSRANTLKYTELCQQMKLAAVHLLNKNIGNTKIKDLIVYCKNNKWILQDKELSPYVLGTYTSSEVQPPIYIGGLNP